MNENIKKIINLDEKLSILKQNNVDQKDICNILEKIIKFLKKLSNEDLINLLNNVSCLYEYIDPIIYFKKYELNKENINKLNYYDEYLNLEKFLNKILDVSINQQEFIKISNKCDLDNVANYLLTNMKNEDIFKIANSIDDWNYKLFLYGYLKP